MKKPELLSPIQDLVSLRAAMDAGADAVYFGVRGFNMRASAKNFTISDIPRITKLAHQYKVNTYLALNTIVYEKELNAVNKILLQAKKYGVDAVICFDPAVIGLGTQMNW